MSQLSPIEDSQHRVHFICRIRKIPSDLKSHGISIQDARSSYNTSTQKSFKLGSEMISPSQSSQRRRNLSSKKGGGGSVTSTPGRSGSKKRSKSANRGMDQTVCIISSVNAESKVVAIGDSKGVIVKDVKSSCIKDDDLFQITDQLEKGKYQEFSFDKVFNDYFQGGKFKTSIKGKVQNAILQRQSVCLLNFGPSDLRPSSHSILSAKGNHLMNDVIRSLVQHQQVRVQAIQVYLSEVSDLLSKDFTKASLRVGISQKGELLSSLHEIQTPQDFQQALKYARSTRAHLSHTILKSDYDEIAKKSHLIIRVTLQNGSLIDYVELCGSEQAFISGIQNTKRCELYQKFVTQSFNSLSTALTTIDHATSDKQSLLLSAIQRTVQDKNTLIYFSCHVHSGKEQFRHSYTALKFVSKIRDALIKRLHRAKNQTFLQELDSMIQQMQSSENSSDPQILGKLLKLREDYQQKIAHGATQSVTLKTGNQLQEEIKKSKTQSMASLKGNLIGIQKTNLLEEVLGKIPQPTSSSDTHSVTFQLHGLSNNIRDIQEKENVSLNISKSTVNVKVNTTGEFISNENSAIKRLSQESKNLLEQYREAKKQTNMARTQSQTSVDISQLSIMTAEDYKAHKLYQQQKQSTLNSVDVRTSQETGLKFGKHFDSVQMAAGSYIISPTKSLPDDESIIKDEVKLEVDPTEKSSAHRSPEDVKSKRLASLLRQKQRDQQDLKEIRFKLDREVKANTQLIKENAQLKKRIADLQEKYIDDEQEAKRMVESNLNTDDYRLIHGTHQRDIILGLCKIVEQKNEQIRQISNFAQMCEQEIQNLQAKEYDSCMDSVKKTSDFEAQIIQMRKDFDSLHKEKRLLEGEIAHSRDQVKELIREKHAIDTKLHNSERLSSQLQSDLDYQIHTLRANITHLTEENRVLKETEEEMKRELEVLTRARDSFKQQFLELRETNKELKVAFKDLEAQVAQCLKDGKLREEKENKIPQQTDIFSNLYLYAVRRQHQWEKFRVQFSSTGEITVRRDF